MSTAFPRLVGGLSRLEHDLDGACVAAACLRRVVCGGIGGERVRVGCRLIRGICPCKGFLVSGERGVGVVAVVSHRSAGR